MYSQILVSLDGSENSERALPHAQELAQASGATLHLIQVVSRSEELNMARGGGYDFLAAEYSQDLALEFIAARINRAGEYLKEAAMRLESGGIKTETAVREGAAAENIVQYAQENGIDLIIMGTRAWAHADKGESSASYWGALLTGYYAPVIYLCWSFPLRNRAGSITQLLLSSCWSNP
jgi:nucleotide-binding universal stress UspA family protein